LRAASGYLDALIGQINAIDARDEPEIDVVLLIKVRGMDEHFFAFLVAAQIFLRERRSVHRPIGLLSDERYRIGSSRLAILFGRRGAGQAATHDNDM
jgi:hypothetical protein